jgi:isocitrate dehydrogenase kinase/phosphatase
MDRAQVQDRYLLVKHHDRVGRMADTLEYSDVAFPLGRFDAALVDELRRLAPGSIEYEGEHLIVKHLYLERRLIPLDLYLQSADEERMREALREYGNAIRDLAKANIFPGDLLLKNFGVTPYGRVVFYDYDEISYLTDVKFRYLPTARYDEDELSADPWFSVGPDDVFPEQFPTFLVPGGRPRELFLEHHADLADPSFWMGQQERLRQGLQDDVYPYPESIRFRERYGPGSSPPGAPQES